MVSTVPVWLRPPHVALVAIVAVSLAGGLFGTRDSDASSRLVSRHVAVTLPHGATVVTVTRGASGTRIPAGFLGLSFEYWAVEDYAGKDPRAVDPVLVQLVRNLAPGQAPVLRIGGDSTDWTWWPVAGLSRPGGVSYTLTRRWLAVTRALSRTLGAHLILGINLEADSEEVAVAEARALTAGLGRASIEALELGNEPELYASLPWYRTRNGIDVFGRAAGWDFAAFAPDFVRVAAGIGPAALAGPSIGDPSWMDLSQLLAAEPRLAVVTLHRYPLWGCFNHPGTPRLPSVAAPLARRSSLPRLASGAPRRAHRQCAVGGWVGPSVED